VRLKARAVLTVASPALAIVSTPRIRPHSFVARGTLTPPSTGTEVAPFVVELW
jgi:hypothetical protein